jgi:RNA polymerase sigma-70 factor (ECF subfamily)
VSLDDRTAREIAMGSTTADFTAWVAPHWTSMSRLAHRLVIGDWEDVLQEALGAAWRKRAQFDPVRGSARNWLLAITADQATKQARRFNRARSEPRADLTPAAPPITDLADQLDLRTSVARLTTRQRTAVTLHYYLGLPVADVAEVMGCAPGTVKSTLSDARSRLRTDLGENYR